MNLQHWIQMFRFNIPAAVHQQALKIPKLESITLELHQERVASHSSFWNRFESPSLFAYDGVCYTELETKWHLILLHWNNWLISPASKNWPKPEWSRWADAEILLSQEKKALRSAFEELVKLEDAGDFTSSKNICIRRKWSSTSSGSW